MAMQRRFGDSVVTGTKMFRDRARRRRPKTCTISRTAATLSPRHAECEVHRNGQIFDDFVKKPDWEIW